MARPLRLEQVSGWYHVSSRGNERKPIFRDDRDRRHFEELLKEMVARFLLRLHCYVLMGNHFHLLVELSETNLGRAIQWLKLSYSMWFNRRHQRIGHLFQGRYNAIAVQPEEWALELSRYVHLNPVRVAKTGMGKKDRAAQRAGLSPAPDASRVQERLKHLEGYLWSSYRAYVGMSPAPVWLECETVLGLGGGRKSQQRRNYRQYVELALREGLEQSPWESLQEQCVLGSEGFLEGLKRTIRGDSQEQRGARRLMRERPGLNAVITALETLRGEPWTQFRDRHGDTGRDLVLYFGRRLCGMTLKQLAEAVELPNYGVVATNALRYEKRLKNDRQEQKIARRICKLLNCEI